MNPASHPLDDYPTACRPGRGTFRRLHALGRVGLRADACLHLHRAWLECTQCESACPYGSLKRGTGVLALDPARCTACGQCAVNCPTGALTVEGFALGTTPAPGPVVMVCDQTAANALAGLDPDHTRRVPCLGGIAANDWLQLALTHPGAALRLFDDRTCEHCPTARGQGNPGLAALDTARRALAAAGVGAEALPQRLIASPLPNGNRNTARPSAVPVAGRRAFFAGLSRALSTTVAHVAAPMALPADARTVAQARTPVPNLRGDESRILLQQLAHMHGRATPRAAQLPALAASEACRAHGTCARVCPTGALELEDRIDHYVLRFDAWQCIDCGACTRTCPEQALELRPAAWRAFVGGALELSATERHHCMRCGGAIATDDADDPAELCDRCSKSQRLARAGFALFHPPDSVTAVAPDPP